MMADKKMTVAKCCAFNKAKGKRCIRTAREKGMCVTHFNSVTNPIGIKRNRPDYDRFLRRVPNSQACVNKYGRIDAWIPEEQIRQVGLKSMSMKQLTANHIFKTVKDAIKPHLINDISNIVMGYVGMTNVTKAIYASHARESKYFSISARNMEMRMTREKLCFNLERRMTPEEICFDTVKNKIRDLYMCGRLNTHRGAHIQVLIDTDFGSIEWDMDELLERCARCDSPNITYAHLLIEKQMLNYLDHGVCQTCYLADPNGVAQ
jgi:hypothetical protein